MRQPATRIPLNQASYIPSAMTSNYMRQQGRQPEHSASSRIHISSAMTSNLTTNSTRRTSVRQSKAPPTNFQLLDIGKSPSSANREMESSTTTTSKSIQQTSIKPIIVTVQQKCAFVLIDTNLTATTYSGTTRIRPHWTVAHSVG